MKTAWIADGRIIVGSQHGIPLWSAAVESYGPHGPRVSWEELEKIATLMAAAPALKAMVERLVSECRGHGFGQLVMDAELLLKELDHGE